MHGAAPRASTGGPTAEARRRATRRDGAGRTDGGRAELEDRSEELQREPYQRDQLNKKLTMAKKQLEQLDTELTVLKHAALDQRMPKVRSANRRHQRDGEEAATNHRRNKEGGKELRARPSPAGGGKRKARVRAGRRSLPLISAVCVLRRRPPCYAGTD